MAVVSKPAGRSNGPRDPRVDAYIARSAPFARPILKHLRALVHAACPQCVETIKWGVPHFDYKGMLCAFASFKAHCTFGFWKGALITGDDAKGREAMGSFGRVTTLGDLPSDATIKRLIKKAMALNDAGIKAKRPPKDPARRTQLDKVPPDLATALKGNAAARKTWDAFPPGAKRDYVEWITGAKRDETRTRRLETAIGWIADGKRHNWQYER